MMRAVGRFMSDSDKVTAPAEACRGMSTPQWMTDERCKEAYSEDKKFGVFFGTTRTGRFLVTNLRYNPNGVGKPAVGGLGIVAPALNTDSAKETSAELAELGEILGKLSGFVTKLAAMEWCAKPVEKKCKEGRPSLTFSPETRILMLRQE
jgi:hypothetical protein